jgi:hypothetical protein
VSSVIAVFIVATGLAATNALITGAPLPVIHDELSYLLGGDTFAHGRLANPPHPLWEHFVTFHVLQQPTYAPKYPPGQAAALALGQRLTGQPIVGVWLSYGVMCAAFFWMLRAFLGAEWALAVTVAVACSLARSPWANSYWGGAVAAAGGALAYGAAYRIVYGGAPTAPNGLTLGVGIIVLANTRPYEGALASIPLAILLLWWARRQFSQRGWRSLAPSALSLGVVLVAGGAGMLGYNRAVSGRATTLAYVLYEREYGSVPSFLWQTSSAMKLGPDVFQQHRDYQQKEFDKRRSLKGIVTALYAVPVSLLTFVVPIALLFPFAMLPLVWRVPGIMFAFGAVLLVLGGMELTSWFFPHYAAPIMAALIAVYGACVRELTSVRRDGRRVGALAAAGVIGCWAASGLFGVLADLYRARAHGRDEFAPTWAVNKRNLERQLLQRSGPSVVLVRYGARHNVGHEWVYNGADVDRAPVVWARALGGAEDDKLAAYYSTRRIWLLEVDDEEHLPEVRPYVRGEARQPTSATSLPTSQ